MWDMPQIDVTHVRHDFILYKVPPSVLHGTLSYFHVWHDSYVHVRHDSRICVTCVQYNSILYKASLVVEYMYTYIQKHFVCDMTHIYMWDMTCEYVWHTCDMTLFAARLHLSLNIYIYGYIYIYMYTKYGIWCVTEIVGVHDICVTWLNLLWSASLFCICA